MDDQYRLNCSSVIFCLVYTYLGFLGGVNIYKSGYFSQKFWFPTPLNIHGNVCPHAFMSKLARTEVSHHIEREHVHSNSVHSNPTMCVHVFSFIFFICSDSWDTWVGLHYLAIILGYLNQTHSSKNQNQWTLMLSNLYLHLCSPVCTPDAFIQLTRYLQ